MTKRGAEEYLRGFLENNDQLGDDCPQGEAEGNLQAMNVAVTAYAAAEILSNDEALEWRHKIAERVIARRSAP